MASQGMSERTRARLFPRPKASRPRLPELEQPAPGPAAHLARVRRILAASVGGTPLAPPDPAPRREPLLALMQRITQGFHPAEYERAKALGYEAYLEEQLAPLSIDDSDLESRLVRFTTLQASPKELFEGYATDFTRPYHELKVAALARSVESKRQLYERMCEFWNDHFSIDHNKGDTEWMLLPEFDRTVIRPHALGSFPAMLTASAFSGAMLYYLDNWLNVRGAAQENYARELMEVHTLGVHGGYHESDVYEVAKCFTGWTLEDDPNSPDWMRGKFDASLHQPGRKFLLAHEVTDLTHIRRPGVPLANSEAQQVLDILAAHPSTAEFLAHKLIRWFLTPTPPPDLVARTAQAYTATNGDIKAMLRVILARENFAFTSPVLGRKFRRPFHYVVSLARALDGRLKLPREPVPVPADMLALLEDMGHVPFDHPQPDGYPDTVEAWGVAPLPRWTFASVILRESGRLPGLFQISSENLRARLGFLADPADRPGLAERMNELFFGRALSPYETRALQAFIDGHASPLDDEGFYDALSLGACMPGFQWF